VKDEHIKGATQDVSQGVEEDVPRDVVKDLTFRARVVRALLATPPPPPPSLCSSR